MTAVGLLLLGPLSLAHGQEAEPAPQTAPDGEQTEPAPQTAPDGEQPDPPVPAEPGPEDVEPAPLRDTADPGPVEADPILPLPDPAGPPIDLPAPTPPPVPPAPPVRVIDDPTLWLFVGPPPQEVAPAPAPPIVWEGPPVLEPTASPDPPAPEPPAPPPASPAPTLGERLTTELRDNVSGLERLLTTWTLVGLLLVLGIGVGGYRVAVRLADAARDAGYDLDRRLVGLRVVAAAGATLWVGGLVARQLLERVPLLAAALIGVFLGGVAVVVARQAVQAVGGMVLVFAARVREGDRLTVGDVSGTVEHAGFLRLRLRRSDGSTVFLPAQALDQGPVTVSSPRRTQAVRVRVGGAERPEQRELLRRQVLLCPFRQDGSEVRFERPEGESDTLDVVIQAWSASAAEEAERWLRTALVGQGLDRR